MFLETPVRLLESARGLILVFAVLFSFVETCVRAHAASGTDLGMAGACWKTGIGWMVLNVCAMSVLRLFTSCFRKQISVNKYLSC